MKEKMEFFDADIYNVKFPIKYMGKTQYVEIPRKLVPFKEVLNAGTIEAIGYDSYNSMIGVQMIQQLDLEHITVKSNRLIWLYPAKKEVFDKFVKADDKVEFFKFLNRTLMSVSEPCETYKFIN